MKLISVNVSLPREISHKGKSETIRSRVGILLTPEYAQSRGFGVAELRAKGLIKDRPQKSGKPRRP